MKVFCPVPAILTSPAFKPRTAPSRASHAWGKIRDTECWNPALMWCMQPCKLKRVAVWCGMHPPSSSNSFLTLSWHLTSLQISTRNLQFKGSWTGTEPGIPRSTHGYGSWVLLKMNVDSQHEMDDWTLNLTTIWPKLQYLWHPDFEPELYLHFTCNV